ncbi:MAG: TonB-dependent receptor [Deinococcales bacterium]|nr:TonB-dependent receptor [Chitinophagaceae bacterium]
MTYFVIVIVCLLHFLSATSQTITIQGAVADANQKAIVGAIIIIQKNHTVTDSVGKFQVNHLLAGNTLLQVTHTSFKSIAKLITITTSNVLPIPIILEHNENILDEVVVTGVTKSMLLKESPVSITNVSGKMIDKTIETNIIDALVKHVPGLNAVKTGPNISKPFIRGLGYNRVLTLYDGMRQEGQQWGDEHGIEVDGYNIEKVEVIKGPASLMFGSDALAGVVSILPYLPKEKDTNLSVKFISEYQHNNGLFGNGIRLSKYTKHWLWSVNGAYRIAKNYTNTIDKRVYNTGFRENNLAGLLGYHNNKGYSHIAITLYNNLQGIPDGSRDSLTRQFTQQVHEGVLDDITNRVIVSNQAINSYTLSPLHQNIKHFRLYTNNHYSIGKGELNATLGFQQNTRIEYNHPTLPKQAGLYVQLQTINYGLTYTLPAFANIEVTVGTNGMHQINKSKNATDFPIPNYQLTDIGGFIFGKWKYNQITVSGGFRIDTRQLKAADFYVGKNPITGFDQQYFLPDTAGAALQFPILNKQFDGTSLSLGFAYQLSNKINLKLNIARGYRSPSITEIASNGLDPGAHIIYLGNRTFKPEFSFQQDVNVTGNFKNFNASVSLFNNNISNYIYLNQVADASGNAIVDAQGNRTFQYQQAAAQLYGAEATFDVFPNLWQGFSFKNSFTIVYGINKKEAYKNTGINGAYLPLLPPAKWLSSIGQIITTKSLIAPIINLGFETEYVAEQNRYLALYNTETYTPAYMLLNISVSTNIKYSKLGSFQLQWQINNLLDKAYQSNLSRLKYFEYYNQTPNGNSGIYNMGRNICVKLIAEF